MSEKKEALSVSEKKGTAATRAKNKYNAENYDRLYPYVKKGKKELYLKAVTAGGFDSLNDFIELALDATTAEILKIK